MTDGNSPRVHNNARREGRDEPLRREDFVSVVVENEDGEEDRRRRRRPRPHDDRRDWRQPRRERPAMIEVEIDGAVVRIPPGADRSAISTVLDLLRERGSRR